MHSDYCFMGAGGVENTRAIVVAKHRDSRSVLASVVPATRSRNDFVARRVCAFLRELGVEHADLTLRRSDQEPAIIDLLKDVSRKRAPAKSLWEQSPVGESARNGRIERENLTFEGQIRVLIDAFGTRIKHKITAEHLILISELVGRIRGGPREQV